MEQTAAHANHNPDLLPSMPKVASIVEVGCSTGALARPIKARTLGPTTWESRWTKAMGKGFANGVLRS
jgi:hypothetical protein